ncbi:hypothetical protein B0O99DRAFT_634047 [Bisporella sp. PMI_857]|nr:hypothetical protein B0O99DRAFT_634047 [Bisporella sp. PMI_857]
MKRIISQVVTRYHRATSKTIATTSSRKVITGRIKTLPHEIRCQIFEAVLLLPWTINSHDALVPATGPLDNLMLAYPELKDEIWAWATLPISRPWLSISPASKYGKNYNCQKKYGLSSSVIVNPKTLVVERKNKFNSLVICFAESKTWVKPGQGISHPNIP